MNVRVTFAKLNFITEGWRKINIRLTPAEVQARKLESNKAYLLRHDEAKERKRERNRKYAQRPDVIAARSTPEYKAWRREYNREYWRKYRSKKARLEKEGNE